MVEHPFHESIIGREGGTRARSPGQLTQIHSKQTIQLWDTREVTRREFVLPTWDLRVMGELPIFTFEYIKQDAREATLLPIRKSIEESSDILDFHISDDGTGPRYSPQVLQRATQLVEALAHASWRSGMSAMAAPDIDPGPAGSIDIHWSMGSRQVVINVPVDVMSPASFFAKEGKLMSSGEVSPENIDARLLEWLRKK